MKRASIIALLLLAANAYAEPPQERRGPPQEFIDACKGKKDGDTVEASTPRGQKVKGVCRMVMMPSNPPGDRPGADRPPAKPGR